MTEENLPRSPEVVIYVEPKENATAPGGQPGPRIGASGISIDGQEYFIPEEGDVTVVVGDAQAMIVTIPFMAHDVQFVERSIS